MHTEVLRSVHRGAGVKSNLCLVTIGPSRVTPVTPWSVPPIRHHRAYTHRSKSASLSPSIPPMANLRYALPNLHLKSATISCKIEVFCEAVPKPAEVRDFHRGKLIRVFLISFTSPQNFLALCASGYYNDCIFHRNIKGFMIQTGDPSGSGKGGQSIWGNPFADEIRSTLKVRSLLHAICSR